MSVFSCCQTNVMTVSPEDTAYDAANIMEEWNVGSVIVKENERPVGIVTDRDLVVRVITTRKIPEETSIREIMTRDPVIVKGDTGLYEAMEQIKGKGIRRLPVVDSDGRLQGIITVDDLIRLLAAEMNCISGILDKELCKIPAR